MILIGAGVIGVELGSVWSRLGTEVSTFLRGEGLDTTLAGYRLSDSFQSRIYNLVPKVSDYYFSKKISYKRVFNCSKIIVSI